MKHNKVQCNKIRHARICFLSIPQEDYQHPENKVHIYLVLHMSRIYQSPRQRKYPISIHEWMNFFMLVLKLSSSTSPSTCPPNSSAFHFFLSFSPTVSGMLLSPTAHLSSAAVSRTENSTLLVYSSLLLSLMDLGFPETRNVAFKGLLHQEVTLAEGANIT